ncbi:unnamed protein product [Boreogadus saida]
MTGILYGAQAFFVFDREVLLKEDRQDIDGDLKVFTWAGNCVQCKETTGPSLSCCAAVDDGDEGVFQVAELLGQPGLAVAAHQVAHLDGATER